MIEEIRAKLSSSLLNRTIIHCVTSSFAIYKAIDIARFLIKHGANVIPVLSEKASKLINPILFEYATGNRPVHKITGKVEHVSLFKENKVDLVLIAPATANTIAKIANGISDSTVTLVASVAIGLGIPMLIVPAMHEPMYENPLIKSSIERLEKLRISFVEPRIEEGKAKIATEEEIFLAVMRLLQEKPLIGKKVLVTAGSTREYIDSVRFITNASSGKMGLAMAKAAWYLGADVLFVHGDVKIEIPRFMKSIHVEDSEEMLSVISDILAKNRIDYFVASAAVVDFKPIAKVEGKIDSKIEKLQLELIPTKKIIKEVKKISKETVLIAFKAEYGMNKNLEELIKDYEFCDYIVVNDISRKDIGFGSDFNEVMFVDVSKRKVKEISKTSKDTLAGLIWKEILYERT